MMKLRLPLTGIAIGIVISIVGIMASAPPCAFADESCPEGATSTFTGTVALKGGTNYTTTLTSASNTDDRTITLPDADGVLMSSSSVDNVTNKTIDFNLNTGTNYNSGDLGGSQLNASVLSSSIDTVGVLSGMDIGSNLTTIDEAAAGDINIEGNTVYRAGGADVPPTQGGTGTSSFTANSVIIGNGASGALSVDTSQKGDLLVGKTGGFPEDLAVGTTGQKLTADSTDPKGMAWTTPSAGGGLETIDGWYYNDTSTSPSSYSPVLLNGTYSQIPSSMGFNPTGPGMTVSSGEFEFPSNGLWEIRAQICTSYVASTNYSMGGMIEFYHYYNWSWNWNYVARDSTGYQSPNASTYCATLSAIVDVTSYSTNKIRFYYWCGSCPTMTAVQEDTSFFFMKLTS